MSSDDELFFLRYKFPIQDDGLYLLCIETDKRQFQMSRYSYVVDDGPVRELVHKRMVGAPTAQVEGLETLALNAGQHALELWFYPHQRPHLISRITEGYLKHRASIRSIRLVPAGEEKQTAAPARRESQKLLLHHGDRLAFLGDSITDEEYYPAHFMRMLRKAYPGENIACYNCGITNNRTWEGLERLERDVVALQPTWVIVNFGVNDGVHMGPEEYEKTYEKIVLRLKNENIRVVCTTPTGFLPEREKKDGRYIHPRDRALGLDRTTEQEAGIVIRLARKHGCLWADTRGALTHSDFPRDRLMYNQWHPNAEGGRLMALALLRVLDFSGSDAARTEDPLDMECFRMVELMPKIEYPSWGVTPRLPSKPVQKKTIVATSFTRDAVYAFSVAGGEIARIPVGHHPMAVAYSRERQELYVTCEVVGRVEIIDARNFERKEPVLTGDIYPLAIALAKDENVAWTGNYFAANVAEIDLREKKVKRELKIDASVQSILLLEERQLLLAGTNNDLVMVDTSTGKVVQRVSLSHVGGFLKLSPNEVGAIDTALWQMHVLGIPDLSVKMSIPPPFPSRAIMIDEETGDIWAGDWKRHKVVRLSRDFVKINEIGNVEFPFGIAIMGREKEAIH